MRNERYRIHRLINRDVGYKIFFSEIESAIKKIRESVLKFTFKNTNYYNIIG